MDPAVARAMYERWTEELGEDLLWKEELLLDGGNPACLLAVSESGADDGGNAREAIVHLLYFYGANMLDMYYECAVQPAKEALVPAFDDWLPFFSRVSYAVPEDRAGLP